MNVKLSPGLLVVSAHAIATTWTSQPAVHTSRADFDAIDQQSADNACICHTPWPQIKKDLWRLFNSDVDVPGLMDCIASGDCSLTEQGMATAGALLMDQECSEEVLPAISTRVCAAGMTHYMILCAIQMWLRGIFRQSVLYFEHSFGFLALCLDCLEGSDWPLWPGQITRNYRAFLAAAFPPGALQTEQKYAAGSPYITAGPAVNPADFRWRTGYREGLYCPPEAEPWSIAPPVEKQSIMCAVPIVWPGEREAAAAIAHTFGKECDELVFFVAAPDAATADHAVMYLTSLAPGAEVVDLAQEWPEMLRDRDDTLAAHGRKGVSGANQKDLLLFTHLAMHRTGRSQPDWVCRVETDSYFAPQNFRRFVAGRRLDPSEPIFLGSISYWQMHFEPRIVFNEQVQCLSWAAVGRLATKVRMAPVASNVSYARCELVPGHRGDLLLAICLAEAGIVPHGDIADAWGREYFLNYRLEDVELYMPDGAYGNNVKDPRAFETNAAQHWRGKAHVFLPCMKRRQQIWASPYPISFHDYKDPAGIYFVHEVMTGQRDCGNFCPKGYVPRIAEDFR